MNRHEVLDMFRTFVHDYVMSDDGEEGQDMIEYALLAALISIVAIAVILLLGPYISNLFQDVVGALSSS